MVTIPSAPSPTTVPSWSGSPRRTVREAPDPSISVSPATAVASDAFVSPEPCVDVATAPATEMCGNEARLARAQPRSWSARETSP